MACSMVRKHLFQILLLSCSIYFVISEDTVSVTKFLQNISDSTQASIILSLLNNAKNILEGADFNTTMNIRCPDEVRSCDKPMDCAEILEGNKTAKSGIYWIWPRNRVIKGSISVYCDMDDDGGGWTVIQRRGNFDSEKQYFFRNWYEYKHGFGDLQKDFWLGNDNIFAVTNQRSNIVKFVLSDWEGNTTYATYDEFWIEEECRQFTMHVSGYRGTAGDSFSFTNGSPFTTKDQDNDAFDKNCAVEFKGAWWYTKCHSSNLNGMYLKGAHTSYSDGVEWYRFRGHYYSLKDTVIKVRPKNFRKEEILDATPHLTSNIRKEISQQLNLKYGKVQPISSKPISTKISNCTEGNAINT